MNKDEALKMAIDDLELCNGAQTVEDIIIYTHEAIQACKEALAQPAQEPVAWMSKKRGDVSKAKMYFNEGEEILPLYTHPAPQPVQEPVAWNEEEFNAIAYAYRTCPAHEIKMVSDRYQELVNYVLSITHPAPAWQGLSEEEIIEEAAKIIILRSFKGENV